MSSIRKPAVAGSFYPSDARQLHQTITQLLQQAAKQQGPVPKAIIAPHAGYIYSGPVAASAYARIQAARDRIKCVVLLGPAHRVPFYGLAASSADYFATPLGTIPVDQIDIRRLTELPQVKILDEAHTDEHSLEVNLPFLQECLGDFSLIPLVVGSTTPEEVCEVLESVWGGDETLIVISSDLSHYYDYDTARRLDSATSHAIESLNPDAIEYESACGRIPVNGLLVIAKKLGLHAHSIDLRNSGDTAGPRDQVVGYGAFEFN
jgi:AmmeMemoRadiSam system protein B